MRLQAVGHGAAVGLRAVLVYQNAALPSSRIRIIQLAPFLEAHGVRCEVLPYPADRQAKAGLRRVWSGADVVVLQKKLPSLVDAQLWRACPAPLIFDYDDALPFRDRTKRGSFESRTRRRRFDRIVALADGLIAGNAYLASLAPVDRPTLLAPSPVPHEVPQHVQRQDPPRVGWIGSKANLPALEALTGALRQLASRRRFELQVVADAPPTFAGLPVSYEPWSLDAQDRLVAGFDVGIMPLPADTPWSAGKCSYKLLQYMAASVPAVATAVGMNAELIEHGENGLLAEDDAGWVRHLERLLDDPAGAATIAAAGRRTVEAGYTYPAIAAAWAEHLGAVAAGGRRR